MNATVQTEDCPKCGFTMCNWPSMTTRCQKCDHEWVMGEKKAPSSNLVAELRAFVAEYGDDCHLQADLARRAADELERLGGETAADPLSKHCYVMSERHLGGFRVIVGFSHLEDASEAHQWIVDRTKQRAQTSREAEDAARWRFAKEQMNYSFDGENRTHYMKAEGREDFQETVDRLRGSSEKTGCSDPDDTPPHLRAQGYRSGKSP